MGVPHCPKCGREIRRQTVDEIADRVMELPAGSKIMLEAPVVRGRKGEYVKELAGFRKSGFARVKIDGIVYDLQEDIKLEKNIKHNIRVVVDRLVVKEGILKRLTESLETALKLADGLVVIDRGGGGDAVFLALFLPRLQHLHRGDRAPPLLLQHAVGRLPDVYGPRIPAARSTPTSSAPTSTKTLREGAIRISGWNLDSSSVTQMYLSALSRRYGFSMDVRPSKSCPKRSTTF